MCCRVTVRSLHCAEGSVTAKHTFIAAHDCVSRGGYGIFDVWQITDQFPRPLRVEALAGTRQ